MTDRETIEETLQVAVDMDSFELDIDGEFPSSWLDYSDEGRSVSFDELPPDFLLQILGGPTGTFDTAAAAAVNDALTFQNDKNCDGDNQGKSKVMPIHPPTKITRRRVRKNYDPPFGKREYYDLSDKDVGLGRGGAMNRHKGNILFHLAKTHYQPAYLQKPKSKRTIISQQLVDEVQSWGGRFLKKDKRGWYEIDNHTARTKCSQALRDTLTPDEKATKRRRYRKSKKQEK